MIPRKITDPSVYTDRGRRLGTMAGRYPVGVGMLTFSAEPPPRLIVLTDVAVAPSTVRCEWRIFHHPIGQGEEQARLEAVLVVAPDDQADLSRVRAFRAEPVTA